MALIASICDRRTVTCMSLGVKILSISLTLGLMACSASAPSQPVSSVSSIPSISKVETIETTAPAVTYESVTVGSMTYKIGDTGPAGGIIFYAVQEPFSCGPQLSLMCNFLESALTDSEVKRGWSNDEYEEVAASGADRTEIGAGYQNTLDIVKQGSTDASLSGAAYAYGYEFGGFTDWFLPSKDEFREQFTHKDVIGGFSVADYWSSTELDPSFAWSQFFYSTHPQLLHPKNHYTHYIRPVRAF